MVQDLISPETSLPVAVSTDFMVLRFLFAPNTSNESILKSDFRCFCHVRLNETNPASSLNQG